MKQYLLTLGALVTALAAFTLPATADQSAAPAAPVDQVAQAASPAPSPSPTAPPKPFQASGYIDTVYDDASQSGARSVIGTRVFDNVSGYPQLNDVNLTLGYTGTIGAKVELNGGSDAVVMHSYPQNPVSICPNGLGSCTAPYNYQVDLTQAYPSFSAGKFTLIAGKFETLAGAEVIESPSDLNISRSILFGYAVPFTHTGARLTFAASPALSVIVGANRGWDTTRELSTSDLAKLGAPAGAADNGSLTGEFGLAYNPTSAASLTVQTYQGKQEDGLAAGCVQGSACHRSLVDVVATYHVNSALTATLNADTAQQTTTYNPSFASGIGTVTWKGIAGYLSYALPGNVTTTLRYESFNDAQGYRGNTGFGYSWNEGTFTVAYAPGARVTFRGEYRVDTATAPIFSFSGPKAPASFGTVGFEAIVHYP